MLQWLSWNVTTRIQPALCNLCLDVCVPYKSPCHCLSLCSLMSNSCCSRFNYVQVQVGPLCVCLQLCTIKNSSFPFSMVTCIAYTVVIVIIGWFFKMHFLVTSNHLHISLFSICGALLHDTSPELVSRYSWTLVESDWNKIFEIEVRPTK